MAEERCWRDTFLGPKNLEVSIAAGTTGWTFRSRRYCALAGAAPERLAVVDGETLPQLPASGVGKIPHRTLREVIETTIRNDNPDCRCE